MWDQVAYRYDYDAAQLTSEHIRHGFGALLPHLPTTTPSTPLKVLDIASGSGAAAFIFALQGHHVLATDYSQGMVDLVTEKARRLGLTHLVQTQLLDATKLDMEGQFDVVNVSFALFAMPDPLAVTKAMVTALKPGGLLLCVNWVECEQSQFHFLLQQVLQLIRPPGAVEGFKKMMNSLGSQKAMTGLFTQAGLKVLDCHQHFALSRQVPTLTLHSLTDTATVRRPCSAHSVLTSCPSPFRVRRSSTPQITPVSVQLQCSAVQSTRRRRGGEANTAPSLTLPLVLSSLCVCVCVCVCVC